MLKVGQKYFIASSLDNPHIYILFRGFLSKVSKTHRQVYMYRFSNIEVIEGDEFIVKYVHGNTFHVGVRRKMFFDLTPTDKKNISAQKLFTEKYGSKHDMSVYQRFVFNTYEDARKMLKEVNEKNTSMIRGMLNDLAYRIDNVENFHT